MKVQLQNLISDCHSHCCGPCGNCCCFDIRMHLFGVRVKYNIVHSWHYSNRCRSGIDLQFLVFFSENIHQVFFECETGLSLLTEHYFKEIKRGVVEESPRV